MRKAFSTQPALFVGPALADHPAVLALDGIERGIDWGAVAALLPQGEGGTGRPGYPAQTLFRALMPGLMHDLSDEKLEAQLARDLAFRRFCRLEIDHCVPEASTPGRFRMAPEAEGRLAAVLAEIDRPLAASGAIVKTGRITIVDASGVEAARSGRCDPDPEGGNRVKQDARGRKRGAWGYQGSGDGTRGRGGRP